MHTASRLVLAAGLAMLAYVVLYLAAVDRDTTRINLNSTALLDARYRLGGRYACAVFVPAHQIDRRIRRGYWEVGAAEALELVIANLDRLQLSRP